MTPQQQIKAYEADLKVIRDKAVKYQIQADLLENIINDLKELDNG